MDTNTPARFHALRVVIFPEHPHHSFGEVSIDGVPDILLGRTYAENARHLLLRQALVNLLLNDPRVIAAFARCRACSLDRGRWPGAAAWSSLYRLVCETLKCPWRGAVIELGWELLRETHERWWSTELRLGSVIVEAERPPFNFRFKSVLGESVQQVRARAYAELECALRTWETASPSPLRRAELHDYALAFYEKHVMYLSVSDMARRYHRRRCHGTCSADHRKTIRAQIEAARKLLSLSPYAWKLPTALTHVLGN